jgi:hypothetical protein
MKQTLLELKPAEMDNTSDRTECLPSTRQDILCHIMDWVTSTSDSQNVFWLYGLAGSGKSTLSTTVASYFRGIGRLGAFIFFDRSFPERSHPSKVIRTLAYRLGLFDNRIGAAISEAINNFPSITDSSLDIQFTKLLVQPLSSLTDLQTEGPIVLVLDALDECGNATERTALLTVLASMLSRLPLMIRVLITSREMEDITAAFASQPNIFARALEVSSETNGRDILTYIRHQMEIICKKKKYLGLDWPGEDTISDLAACACGLFIWASTASKFIDGHDPQKRLNIILTGQTGTKAESVLDSLYTTALDDAGAWDDDDFVEDFRAILGMILVLRKPLSSSVLDQLMNAPKGREPIHTISALGCILSRVPTVHLLHPSFADFLFSRARCGRDEWYIEPVSCHRRLSVQCLDLLDHALKRNVSNLTLSMDLADETLPEDVSYACTFFIDHICVVNDDVLQVIKVLEAFLAQHLLHWLEAMSILRKSRNSVALLDNLRGWISVSLSPAYVANWRCKLVYHRNTLQTTRALLDSSVMHTDLLSYSPNR